MSDNIFKAIEQKPHRLYIIYLMTKKVSPSGIVSNLRKMGLSAAATTTFAQYFELKMKPVMKALGIGHLYQDYISSIVRMLAGDTGIKYPKNMRYRTSVMGNTTDEINFLRFLKAMGVIDMWASEIRGVYGSKERYPIDPDTRKPFAIGTSDASIPWQIIESPQRNLFDEMIVEGMRDQEIAIHATDTLGIVCSQNHIRAYRDFFFNLNIEDLRDQVEIIESEKDNILFQLSELDKEIGKMSSGSSGDENDISEIADMMVARRKLVLRIADLDGLIANLNANLSEISAAMGLAKRESYNEMFQDMMGSVFAKFKRYEKQNDRAVVDPMSKCVRMMQGIMDMTEKADKLNDSGKVKAQAEMINLIQQREDEEREERLKAIDNISSEHFFDGEDVDLSDIDGLDELNAGMPKAESEGKCD